MPMTVKKTVKPSLPPAHDRLITDTAEINKHCEPARKQTFVTTNATGAA